jgi:transcriptional regulator GlxA family with amidase domain
MGAATATAVMSVVGPATVHAATAAGRRRAGTLRTRILLYDGAEELDSIGPAEVFDIAREYFGADLAVDYVTLGEPRVVPLNRGGRLAVTGRWDPAGTDLVVVPGGGWRDPSAPGTHREIASGAIPRALAGSRDGTRIFASVCVGALLLSAAGFLDGRPCTTHALAREKLAGEGGVLKSARVVDDGDVLTAGGVSSGLDLALWLLEREFGPDLAVATERILEYERRGAVWRAA